MKQSKTGGPRAEASSTKLRKEVAVPAGVGRPPMYPFRSLDVGASFSAPAKKAASLDTLACSFGKKLGRRFAVRRTENVAVVVRLS